MSDLINETPEHQEWVGMPEFVQEKKEPYKKLTVNFIDGTTLFLRFNNEDDFKTYRYRQLRFNFADITASRDLFSKVVNQKITEKTKSIWFPYKSHFTGDKRVYKNE